MYEKIRESFLDGLSAFYSRGAMPGGISINMRRALLEHSKRLKSKGVSYREHFARTVDERAGESRFESGSFITTNCHKHCNSITEMRDNMSVLKCDEASDDVVYMHVIDRKDNDISGSDEDRIITCPNCGHTGKAGIFAGGCPMCGTGFEIDDLYPCVNSYYIMPWPLPAQDNMEDKIDRAKKRAIKFGIVVASVTAFINLCAGRHIALVILIGLVVGFLFGWMTFVFSIFANVGALSVKATAGLVKMAGNTLDMAGALNSKAYTEAAMAPYDPDFAFEVFEGKILSSLRTVAFTDKRQDCSIYSGNDDLSFMDDLIDMRYRGATEFKRVFLDGDYVHADMKVYLDDIYYRDGKFQRVRENLDVDLMRRKDVHTPADFTVYSVNCKGCGGTFDAVLSRKCPYCGAPYELANQDWSIAGISICR